MMTAEEKVQKATMQLVLNKPFIATLILRLKISPDTRGHPTLWTDGRVIRYNREFIMKLTFDELIAVLAHEVLHCALAHPYRRGQRDLKLFQEACDYAVNAIIKEDESFSLPGCAYFDERFVSMSAEQIYSILEREKGKQQEEQEQKKQQQQGAQGVGATGGEGEEGEGEPGQKDGAPKDPADEGDAGEESSGDDSDDDTDEQGEPSDQDDSLRDAPGTEQGDVLDAGTSGEGEDDAEPESDDEASGSDRDPSDLAEEESEHQAQSQQSKQMSEADLKQEMDDWLAAAAEAAMQAEAMGQLSANALRQIEKGRDPIASYAEYVRTFVSQFSREDESWNRPSKRFASQGIYMPAMRTEAVGKLVIAIDTSGSISEQDLAMFEGEMRGIHADLRPEEIIVLYADAAVRDEQRIARFDEVAFDAEKIKGGGGTDFCPVFKWVHAQREEGENIIGVIYVTDLDGSFPEQTEEWFDASLPVLWVATEGRDHHFGEACYLFNR